MKKYWFSLAVLTALLLQESAAPSPRAFLQETPAITHAPSAPASKPTNPTAPADSAAPENPPPAVPATPLFPNAEILATHEIPLPKNRVQQNRLLRIPSERSLVRVEEIWTAAPPTSPQNSAPPPRPISRRAMLAGQIHLRIDEPNLPALRSLAEKHGYRPRNGKWKTGRIVLELNSSDLDSVPQALAILENAFGDAILAEPDYLFFPTLSANDPRLFEQWALDRIQAREAWDFSTGSPDAVVAVIDSGAMLSHPDLAANLAANQKDFVDNDNFPDDQGGHGTHVAGIIGATGNNAIGIAGLNWQTGILALRVGNATFSTSLIVDALEYVVDLKLNHGVNIVATNNSYGAADAPENLRIAIEQTRDAGILFIAAAGNSGWNLDTTPSYPAAYTTENIISVASTTSGDLLDGKSNYGSGFVHLAAPGASILSTTFNGGYGWKSGTSMAAPYVAGAAALIASASPEMTWQEIKETLLATADPLPALQGKTTTGGRLNVHRALRRAVLGNRRLEISSPAVSAIRLADNSLSLHLEAALAGDPSASITWETALENSGVTFTAHPESGTLAAFPGPGDYLLHAKTTVDEFEFRSESIFVRVGPGDVLTPGLTGFWKMDDASGTTATDSSENASHGTLLGNATWTDGEIGGALDFDGLNSRVQFHASSSPQISISAWVRSDSPGPHIFPRIVEGPEYILFFGRDETGIEPANRGTIKFLASKTGTDGVWYSSPHSIGDGEWLHVAVTYDATTATNSPSIFLNGKPLPVSAQVSPIGNRAPHGTEWSIGDDAQNTRPWDGQIDELRIYDRLLSPEEIQTLALQPSATTIPAPVFQIPPSIVQNAPATFHTEFPAEWTNEAPSTWTILSGPSTPQTSSPPFVFPEPGTYRLLYETENSGLRLAKFLQIEVAPALPPLTFEISADRTETIRHPAFPVTLRVTANRPVETATDLALHLTGDAQPGTDFQPLPQNLLIPAGESSAQITLIPLPHPTPTTATLRLQVSSTNGHPISPDPIEIHFAPYRFENWQNYFAAQGSEPSPAAIPSADGFPNLLKYALGLPLDETIPRTHPNLPKTALHRETENPHLTLTFRRPTAATDLDFIPEFLDPATGTWHPLTAPIETSPLPNGYEQITIHDPVPLTATTTRLLRLKIRLHPTN